MEQRAEILPFQRELPHYIPMIAHGSKRARPLKESWVATCTYDHIEYSSAPRRSDRKEIREQLCVENASNVLLVSVKEDAPLERFWRLAEAEGLSKLAQMGVNGVTTPNYSIFEDAPRTHTIRNLWRTVRSAEALSEASLPPLIHTNAICKEDWRWWLTFLKENRHIRHICKEFQTGLSNPEKAREALNGMRQLQDSLGRALHPVVVGGRTIIPTLSRHFESWTLVDSTPFFSAVYRKRLVIDPGSLSVSEEDAPTETAETLDRLLRKNLAEYRRLVELLAQRDR